VVDNQRALLVGGNARRPEQLDRSTIEAQSENARRRFESEGRIRRRSAATARLKAVRAFLKVGGE